MARDIRRSKRGYNKFCKWWTRNEDEEISNNEIVMNRQPSGTFYAKEEVPIKKDNNITGGVFMVDRKTVTISTPDACNEIKNNDIIQYKDVIWCVIDVQQREFRSNASEFLNEEAISYDWFISLRRE